MIVFDPVRLDTECEVSNGSRALLIGDALADRVRAALPDVAVISAHTLLEGVWHAGSDRFELILVELDREGRTAAAIRGLRETAPGARILVICDPHDEPSAIRLIDAGADDYVVAPLLGRDLHEKRHAPRARSLAPDPPPSPQAQAELTNQVLARIGHGPEVLLPALASLLSCVLQATGVTIEIDDFKFAGASDDDVVIEQPIVVGDAVRGRIRLSRAYGGAYPADVVARLEPYAAMVATALDQDRSARGWVDLALTDELTGLLNRRGFESELDRRLATAADERWRLTLVRFDIDDFKAYNERCGRTGGDRLLAELAVLLRHCTRKSDIVARFAEDEFAILLVDDGRRRRSDSEHPRSAATLADRFEHAVTEHAFERLGPNAPEPVRLTVGLASYPWQATTRGDLLARAEPLGEDRLASEHIRLAGTSE